MTTVLSFASQKGGVGKTTSAINMSAALALGGYRVLMIDLDPQDSVRTALGISDAQVPGILELFSSADVSAEELCLETDHQNLDFIVSNITRMAEERQVLKAASNHQHLKTWLQQNVRGKYDFVVIDSPPSTGPLSVNALVAADLVIIPVQCEALAVKSLKRFLRIFKELQSHVGTELRIAGILLTMYDRHVRSHRLISRQIYQALKTSVFQTIIPKCDQILEASGVGQSVINKSLPSIGATAYVRLANEVLDRFNIR